MAVSHDYIQSIEEMENVKSCTLIRSTVTKAGAEEENLGNFSTAPDTDFIMENFGPGNYALIVYYKKGTEHKQRKFNLGKLGGSLPLFEQRETDKMNNEISEVLKQQNIMIMQMREDQKSFKESIVSLIEKMPKQQQTSGINDQLTMMLLKNMMDTQSHVLSNYKEGLKAGMEYAQEMFEDDDDEPQSSAFDKLFEMMPKNMFNGGGNETNLQNEFKDLG